MGNVYYYSLGITGDELWSDPNDSDRLMVLYAGIQHHKAVTVVRVAPKLIPCDAERIVVYISHFKSSNTDDF